MPRGKLVITASTKCGRAVEWVLFALPYATVAWTAAWMLLLSHRGGPAAAVSSTTTQRGHDEITIPSCNRILTVLGSVLFGMILLCGLGFPFLGNHYLKIYSWLVVFAASVALLFARDLRGAGALVLLFWVPAIALLWALLEIPSADEIVPRLYLGNRKAAACRNPHSLLREYSITHVLELADGRGTAEAEADRSRTACGSDRHLSLSVTDTLGSHESLTEDLLAEGVAFIRQALESNPSNRVLVHCGAGCSRSPAVVLYYLAEVHNLSMDDAYARIRRRRPVVDTSVDHWTAVRRILAAKGDRGKAE